jgi:hypothetical protein
LSLKRSTVAPLPPPLPPVIVVSVTPVTRPYWSIVTLALFVALPYVPAVTPLLARLTASAVTLIPVPAPMFSVTSPVIPPPTKPLPATTLVISPDPPPPQLLKSTVLPPLMLRLLPLKVSVCASLSPLVNPLAARYAATLLSP